MKFTVVAAVVLWWIGCSGSEDRANLEQGGERAIRSPEVESSGLAARLGSEGVDFYARGNEPPWALDMDLDSVVRFTVLGGLSLSCPAADGVQAQDADILRFHSETEAGTLAVTIMEEMCVDPISGEEFTHRVRVEVTRAVDTESQTFEGCGRYIRDARLGGSWILQELNGEAITGEGLMKGPPTLEFRVEEGRVSGHGGCNALMGTYLNQWKMLRFGQLASTMMACPDMGVEQKYMAAISGIPFHYEFKHRELVLTGPEGTSLRFRRGE